MDINEKDFNTLVALKNNLEQEELEKSKDKSKAENKENRGAALAKTKRAGSFSENHVFYRNTAGKLEKISKNSEALLEKKIRGAVNELARQTQRDVSIEDNLSGGLETNPGYVKKLKIIDDKRIWVYERAKNTINTTDEIVFNQPYVFDEAARQAMNQLEEELVDPFAKNIYSKLSEINKQVLLDYLVDNPVNPDKSEISRLKYASPAYYNTICFSDNGYLMQLINKKKLVKDEDLEIDNEAALYSIINPSGKVINQNLDYEAALKILEDESSTYQEQLKEEFLRNKHEAILRNLASEQSSIEEEDQNKKDEDDYLENFKTSGSDFKNLEKNDRIVSARPLVKMTDEEYSILYQKAHTPTKDAETEYTNTYYEHHAEEKPVNNLELPLHEEADKQNPVVESDNNLEPDLKNDVDNVIQKPVNDLNINIPIPVNFDQTVLEYAGNMGLKPEELEKNQEFVSLNPAQQEFVLEVLNRSSLNKIKVAAYHNFNDEKASKKWWQVGFALNEKFHKKKHEVLAAKNIHERGLEGYGETELSWIIEVIKNGPEIKIDQDNDDEVSVSYLIPEAGDDDNRLELINIYNSDAYYLSQHPSEKNKDNHWADALEASRTNLLESAKDGDDQNNLAARLIEAEKQLKLHQFLTADPNSEKIIENLVNNSLGGWDKFKMIVGGQKDKAQYTGIGAAARLGLRSEVATALIGKGLTYAVGPAVASVMGGVRTYNKASGSLEEKSELAKLGIKDNSKMAENLNSAVSLEVKLESLMSRHSLLEDKLNEAVSHDEISAAQKELKELDNRLEQRIDYITHKMTNDLVSFGAPNERAINYYKLLNSLENAKSLLFMNVNVLRYNKLSGEIPVADKKITRLTRSENILDKKDDQEFLTELHQLSVEDRLASFLGYNEAKRKSAEFKYLMKETGKGAVLGASFAVVGAWIFEHTGLGDWTSAKLNSLVKISHIENLQVGQHLHSAWEETKNLFSSDEDASKVEIAANKIASVAGSSNLVDHSIATKSSILPDSHHNQIIDSKPVVRQSIVETSEPKTLETKIPVVEKSITKPASYSNEIKSENGKSGSLWRSTREIFKNHSQEFGYKGDTSDQSALNRWAETQTANTIHNSSNVEDLVHDGNRVVMSHDGNGYKINVEQGDGLKPGHLNSEIIKEVPRPKVSQNHGQTLTGRSELAALSRKPALASFKNTPFIKDVPKLLYLKPESFEIKGQNLIYQSSEGRVVLDLTAKTIKEVFDANNKIVPQEFINEFKGRVPIDRFARHGGLDKALISWKKLSPLDKSVYESLKLEPAKLLKRITELFGVKTDNGVFVGDKSFTLTNTHRSFDKNFEGIKKLAKFLARK